MGSIYSRKLLIGAVLLAVAGIILFTSFLGANSLLAVVEPTRTPTPCFGCISPKGPLAPTLSSPPISQVVDLAPNLALSEKARVIVRRKNGTYVELHVSPQWSRSQIPLEQGDTIVTEYPPASLMGRHPPQPTLQPLRQSTSPMQENEAIEFASQVLRSYGLAGTPDSVVATQTTLGKFVQVGDLSNEPVWFVTVTGTFNPGQKSQMYVIFNATTGAIRRLGEGTPGELPRGSVIPPTPTIVR